MTTSLDGVFGVEEEKVDLLEFLRNPTKRPVVLVAPPGNGKTFLLKALVQELECDSMVISPWRLYYKFPYLPRSLNQAWYFWKMTRLRPSSVIIVEDAQEFSAEVQQKIVEVWKKRSQANLVFLSTEIPPIVLNKTLIIEWSLPDFEARKETIQGHVRELSKKYAIQNNLQDADYNWLARHSAGFSHANIFTLISAFYAKKVHGISFNCPKHDLLAHFQNA